MESKEQFIHAFMVSDVIQYLYFKLIISYRQLSNGYFGLFFTEMNPTNPE